MLPPRSACVLLAALALAAPAARAGPRPPRAAASRPAAHAWATREQLRECFAGQDALDARRAALEAREAEHGRRMDALEAENAKLVEQEGRLDSGSQVDVDAFNQAVAEHNAHVRQANEANAGNRVETDAYNAAVKEQNRRCSQLVYRVEDMDAVMKERQSGGH